MLYSENNQSGCESKKERITLEEAIQIALNKNRNLADSKAFFVKSRLLVKNEMNFFELKILPNAETSMSGSNNMETEISSGIGVKFKKEFIPGTTIFISPQIKKNNEDDCRKGVEMQLVQPLFRGFGKDINLSDLRGAKYSCRTANRALHISRANTILATVSAVYEVVKLREILKLNKESVKRLKGYFEVSRIKAGIGLAGPSDIYRADIELKQAKDDLASVQRSYEAALDHLKIILVFPLNDQLDIMAPLKYDIIRIDEAEAVSLALDMRVEIDQAADGLREARRLEKVAKHNLLPELNLIMNYSYFRNNDLSLNSADDDDSAWSVGLGTSIDLSRSSERIAHEYRMINIIEARRNISKKRDDIIREIKRSISNLLKSEKSIRIRQEQVKQSERQLELAYIKFRQGLADNFDLIEAETVLRLGQINILTSVINYITGTYRLRYAMGTLLEKPESF